MKQALENLKFRKKLLLIFGLSVLISLIVFVWIMTSRCIQMYSQRYIANSEMWIAQIQDTFERRTGEIQKQLFNTSNMFRAPQNLKTYEDQKNSASERELKYSLNQMVSSASTFDYVYAESMEGCFTDTSEKLKESAEEMRTFLQGMISEKKEEVKREGYVWVSDDKNDIYLIHCVRRIEDLKMVGFIAARIKQNMIETLQEGKEGTSVLFYNRQQSCIYMDQVPEEIRRYLLQEFSDTPDEIQIPDERTYNENRYYLIRQNGKVWRAVGICSMKEAETFRKDMIWNGVLIGLLSIMIGGGLMYCLTWTISLQLDALMGSMHHVSEGDFSAQTPVYSHDDIGELAETFNEMNRQIRTLMEKNISESTLKKQAELEALDYRYRFLQGQINPHFIYNAFETINAMAKLHQEDEISTTMQMIARYFRTTMAYSNCQYITLSEELHTLENYISIYHEIQKSNLITDIFCPEDLKLKQIPSMILQPIVENCFMHAQRSSSDLLVVRIEVSQEEGHLLVRIEDNGIGISATERKGGERAMAKGAHLGIGLENIRERLRLLYGEEGSLNISSCEFGTTVVIRIPEEIKH